MDIWKWTNFVDKTIPTKRQYPKLTKIILTQMLFARAQYKLPRRKLCRYRSKLEHLNTHTQPPEASKPTDYYQTWINLCRRKYLCPLVSQIRSALRANVPPKSRTKFNQLNRKHAQFGCLTLGAELWCRCCFQAYVLRKWLRNSFCVVENLNFNSISWISS